MVAMVEAGPEGKQDKETSASSTEAPPTQRGKIRFFNVRCGFGVVASPVYGDIWFFEKPAWFPKEPGAAVGIEAIFEEWVNKNGKTQARNLRPAEVTSGETNTASVAQQIAVMKDQYRLHKKEDESDDDDDEDEGARKKKRKKKSSKEDQTDGKRKKEDGKKKRDKDKTSSGGIPNPLSMAMPGGMSSMMHPGGMQGMFNMYAAMNAQMQQGQGAAAPSQGKKDKKVKKKKKKRNASSENSDDDL